MNYIEQFVISIESLSPALTFRFICYVVAISCFVRFGFCLADWDLRTYKNAFSYLCAFLKKKKDR